MLGEGHHASPHPARGCGFCHGDGRCGKCRGTGKLRARGAWFKRHVEVDCHACAGSGVCPLCHGERRVVSVPRPANGAGRA